LPAALAGSVAAFERPPVDLGFAEWWISLVLLSWFHQYLQELNFWHD